MILTYKYRLFTRNREEKALDFLLSQARFVYNKGLELRRDAYEKDKKSLSYSDQCKHFRDIRRSEPERLGKLNATCVQQTLRRLDKAFAAFFRRVKRGEKAGYPRFKGAHRFNTLNFTYRDGCKIIDDNGRKLLRIQNVGEVKIKYHRELPEGTIKRVMVTRSNGKYFACIFVDVPDAKPTEGRNMVGIDAGISSLLTLSDGQKIENPQWLRQSLAKLRKQQRHVARCTKGTNTRRKAVALLAKTHQKIANQRRDFWHKTCKKIVDTFDIIAIEDLKLAFMLKNKHLSLSASDAALGLGFEILVGKAEKAGKRVIKVDPKNTSQECSDCGAIVKKSLNVRVHKCPNCGLNLDRDHNAARNILRRGYRLVSVTWDDSPCVLAEAV